MKMSLGDASRKRIQLFPRTHEGNDKNTEMVDKTQNNTRKRNINEMYRILSTSTNDEDKLLWKLLGRKRSERKMRLGI